MTMATGVWPFKTPMRPLFFPCRPRCGCVAEQNTYLGPLGGGVSGAVVHLHGPVHFAVAHSPHGGLLGFAKVYLAVLLQRWLGSHARGPAAARLNLPAMRSSPGGRMSWP